MEEEPRAATFESRTDATPWTTGPSSRDRSTVLRAVQALLDALAPEQQQLTRRERASERIERHRTPSACVLQGPTAALSVSWFPDAVRDGRFGELRVIVWRGVVSRRGAPRMREGASVVSELVLRPVLTGPADCEWEDAAGSRYDVPTLASHCVSLLEDLLSA